MSLQPSARSADLDRLREEGYAVEVRGGYLLLHDVPYVDEARQVRRGTLVSTLVMSGDVTATPDTHVAYFSGATPCDQHGTPLSRIFHSSERKELAPGLVVDHAFSSKPIGHGVYADYHEKMTTYATILATPAGALDPEATPRVFRVVETQEEDSPFLYADTASSRAEIDMITQKLRGHRLAIIGLGGTGSYILDSTAKTPVAAIHLYDGDVFLQHNAFRSPGAASKEVLRERLPKVEYYARIYARLRRGVVPHHCYVDESNVDELQEMDFVFLALDKAAAKKVIVDALEQAGVPFIDVGMGVYEADGALGGTLRVTTSTPNRRDHLHSRVSFADAGDDEYDRNIQIGDLNALNAMLAVIRWKKECGFYADFDFEHHCTYTISGNQLLNADRPDED